ncbi:S-methyl-5-thioribose kinase [Litchfieldia alkalitelluris]|uniref:S-methyl-5-thioribose kinase n=1 Tax=Litchfieldia alkalitelluris TaxID=304268 RepID=UPI000998C628|nr:S-methyl-5-thioribose kinase [Litchfieldia alkalitelluris]
MAITSKSIYEPLTSNSAIALATRLELFQDSSALTSIEIGDGKVNLVFHIVDQTTKKGIIIKQALPNAKVVSESLPLSLKRATIESNYLLINGNYVSQFVPKVHYCDEILAVTVMEDLSHLQISRAGFIEGKAYPKLAEHIGTSLAHTLFYTSDFGMEPMNKKQLEKKFSNPELSKIAEDLVFTNPFFDHHTNRFEVELQQDITKISGDELLKQEVAKLKHKFLTQADALLHGNLHTGSIFASNEETKVINPTFSFYGPLGFDIGIFIASLLLNAVSRKGESQQLPLFDHINKTWEVFSSTFSELWEKDSLEVYIHIDGLLNNLLAQVFEDTIGFAGCELIRRTIGLADVADLDGITNDKERLQAKRHALELGRHLIKNRKVIKDTEQIKYYFNKTQI